MKLFAALSLDEGGNPAILKNASRTEHKETVRKFAHSLFAEVCTICSDGYRSYILALDGYTHEDKQVLRSQFWSATLVATLSSLKLKAFILHTYHNQPKKNLQVYLDRVFLSLEPPRLWWLPNGVFDLGS